MARNPTMIAREISRLTEGHCKMDYWTRKFLIEGYGPKRARFWLREFQELGLARIKSDDTIILAWDASE